MKFKEKKFKKNICKIALSCIDAMIENAIRNGSNFDCWENSMHVVDIYCDDISLASETDHFLITAFLNYVQNGYSYETALNRIQNIVDMFEYGKMFC